MNDCLGICCECQAKKRADCSGKKMKLVCETNKCLGWNNNRYGITIDGNKLTPQRVPDSYTRAFLSSVDYTENCYSCRYATLSRVSDITLGDARGQLSRSERDGASLILWQTQKGISLVNKANMHLEEVDLDKAVAANHQLKHPPEKHPRRE